MLKNGAGTIFNIQRYSVNDGPGIRTLVFFKGCPLRCEWCSNPESQKIKRQIMVFDNLCTQCGTCVAVCPNSCITIQEDKRIYYPKNCDRCGQCRDICPNSAVKLVGEKMSIKDVVAIAEKDYLFYLNSGGGVTLGGGEPTMQPEFATNLLQALKKYGIHTVIETCGYTEWRIFERLLPFIDLVLYDVKHINPLTHEAQTGKSNQRILRNLVNLLGKKAPVIIRIPVIPGFNDDIQAMSEIGLFLNTHNHNAVIERVDLLPYHKLGINKYKALGLSYKLDGSQTPEKKRLEELKQTLVDHGYKTSIEFL